MGVVHKATLSPSKQEIVEGWLPTREWARGRTIAQKIAEYRLDDPEGEVGVETILWRLDDGAVIQTPLTYRAAPLAGADEHLLATTQHSVLGERWVYDGCGDPVWASTLATAIVTGGQQSQMYVEDDDGTRVDIPARMQVRGSGSDVDGPTVSNIDEVGDEGGVTVVRSGDVELAIARVVGTQLDEGPHLSGTVADDVGGETTVLAVLRT